MLILIGLELGASPKLLAEIIGISPSALSRRHDAARRKLRNAKQRSWCRRSFSITEAALTENRKIASLTPICDINERRNINNLTNGESIDF